MTRSKVIASSVLGLLLLTAAVWWFWPQPAVVHTDNLKYIQLLRTAVSSQRVDYLDGVERSLQQRRETGGMTPREWREFESILAMAKANQWKQADQAAMRLESAQQNRRR